MKALVFLGKEPPFSDSKHSTIPVFPVSVQLLWMPFSDLGQVSVSLGHILLNGDTDVLKKMKQGKSLEYLYPYEC